MTVPVSIQTEPIPGYRLLERLGRGGFGEVWKCEAPGGIHKAIKFVYGDLEGAHDDGKPAEQEFKALARVKQVRHPFVLSIERYEVIEGQLLIVMELADRNLWDRFRECRAQGQPGVPREELLRYMAEAAEALDLMNQEYNLQHLDIKPQNLFLVHTHVKVADFGLVKDFEGMSATVTGGVTPVYAAPETFEGRVSRYCDQYSLAIVYQELLTGQRPFNGTTTRQLLFQHLQQPPDLKPLPEGDRAAVARALAKKPDERYPTCAEFIRAVHAGAGCAAPVGGPAADGGAGQATPHTALSTPHTDAPAAAPAVSGLRSGLRIPRASELVRRRDPTVTQGVGNAPPTMQRPSFVQSVLLGQGGVARPEQTGDGCLFPAVVVGVGHLGGLVVRRLRRAVVERFGSAQSVPHLRLLALDTDVDALRQLAGSRPTALQPREVVITRLRRPSHYLNKGRETGVAVETWLDPRALYRMPRLPATTGLRGLGRLAFWDHFHPLEQRLRAELEAALDPAALDEANRQTLLGLRSNRPRVYVVAGLAGGTGGGMALDLAYLARHALGKLGYLQPEVVGVLLLPPADRPAGKALALANTYAALAELYHYGRPDTRYELKVSARQPPVIDSERPFARCLCLPLPPAAGAPARAQATGQTAALLFRELLAPLGRVADQAREQGRATGARESQTESPPARPAPLSPAPAAEAICHTAASYRLGFPRPQLTRRAGQRLGSYLIQLWMAKEPGPVRPAVQAWLDEQWEARHLRPELVVERIQEACQAALGQAPDAKFDALVAPLAGREALGSRPDARAACKVFDEVIQLVGQPTAKDQAGEPAGLLQYSVADAVQALTGEYEQKLAELAVYFIELPQYRLAAAEEAIHQLTERLEQVLDTYEQLQAQLHRDAAECYSRLLALIGALETTQAAHRRAALAGDVLELLRAYPRKRQQAMVAELVLSVYRSMVNTAPEYLREVNFCRGRLADVLAALDDAAAAEESALGPGHDLFPGGGASLDDAAARLVQSLTVEELLELDNRVQQQVRRQFRAVVSYCLEAKGHAEPLKDLVVQQAQEFLAERLGETGVGEVFFQHFGGDAQAAARLLAQAYDEAAPWLAGPKAPGAGADVLAAPAGLAGERVRALVREAVPGVELTAADGGDEVVFHRERHGLALTDLPQLGPQARDAYQKQLDGDQPPHARCDVAWQLPPGR
jgi:hypothetical protein